MSDETSETGARDAMPPAGAPFNCRCVAVSLRTWRAYRYDRSPPAWALRAWARETGRDAGGGSLWRAWRREVWTGGWPVKLRRFGRTEKGRKIGREMLTSGQIGQIGGVALVTDLMATDADRYHLADSFGSIPARVLTPTSDAERLHMVRAFARAERHLSAGGRILGVTVPAVEFRDEPPPPDSDWDGFWATVADRARTSPDLTLPHLSPTLPRLILTGSTEPGADVGAAFLHELADDLDQRMTGAALGGLRASTFSALASEPGPTLTIEDVRAALDKAKAPPPPGAWPPFHPTRLAVTSDLYTRLARLTVEGPAPSLFDALPVTVDEALPAGTGCYTGPDPSALGGVGVALFRIEGDRMVIAGSGGEQEVRDGE